MSEWIDAGRLDWLIEQVIAEHGDELIEPSPVAAVATPSGAAFAAHV